MSKIKKKTKTNIGKEGDKNGNFNQTYFLNGPLLDLPFLMVEDSDCNCDCNGLE